MWHLQPQQKDHPNSDQQLCLQPQSCGNDRRDVRGLHRRRGWRLKATMASHARRERKGKRKEREKRELALQPLHSWCDAKNKEVVRRWGFQKKWCDTRVFRRRRAALRFVRCFFFGLHFNTNFLGGNTVFGHKIVIFFVGYVFPLL